MSELVYVSITGLQLRRFWYAPVFWRYAIASMGQARRALGCLSAEPRTIAGVHHTLSVWTSRDAMLTFLRQGAHLKAMKLFPKIATGKTVGYETTEIPTWDEVYRIWRERGKPV